MRVVMIPFGVRGFFFLEQGVGSHAYRDLHCLYPTWKVPKARNNTIVVGELW
jgi:hypothetical protein